MSNIDFSVKHASFGSETAAHGTRSTKQKIQMIVNVALISAAFLFVGAAVIGVFP